MTTSAEKVESAKQLIRLGLALLPLVPGGKTPTGPWAHGEWTYDRLVKYLEEHPNANIGVMTGSASYDLAVIDVDNHGVDGRKFMRAFERAEGKLGETLTVRTGSGARTCTTACRATSRCRATRPTPGWGSTSAARAATSSPRRPCWRAVAGIASCPGAAPGKSTSRPPTSAC